MSIIEGGFPMFTWFMDGPFYFNEKLKKCLPNWQIYQIIILIIDFTIFFIQTAMLDFSFNYLYYRYLKHMWIKILQTKISCEK